MGRTRTLGAALALTLALCGCDERGAAGVGDGPGQVQREVLEPASVQRVASRSRSSAAALRLAAADGDAEGLPGGEVFDGSAKGRAALGGGGDAQGSVPGGGADAPGGGGPVAVTRKAKHRLVGEPPKPGQKLPEVSLPAANPEGSVQGAGPVLAAFDAFQRKAYAAVTPVFSRVAWGAKASRAPNLKIRPTHVTVHHTAGHKRHELAQSLSGMRGIQEFHQDDRGWGDIGYHFVLDGEGRIFEGRHADIMGAHAGGANKDNVGISLMGNYNNDAVSEGQKTSLRRLITFLALRYRSDPAIDGFIQPHRHYNNTSCPGKNVLAFLDALRREVIGETRTLLSGGKPSGASDSFVPLAVVNA
jgi:hypothetical protein